jgi:hypothetical protein
MWPFLSTLADVIIYRALHHSIRGKNIPGEICYSVGYFPKVLPKEDADGHSPKDTDLPKDFQDKEEMQGDHRPKTMDAEEDRIIAMLPSDDYPSGILSIRERTDPPYQSCLHLC